MKSAKILISLCCVLLATNALGATCSPAPTTKTIRGPGGPVTLHVYTRLSTDCAKSFQIIRRVPRT